MPPKRPTGTPPRGREHRTGTDRKEPLFRELFPKLPRSAASRTASSSAALLRRCLPLAKSADPVDALLVATELYDCMDDAFDVAGSGKRAHARWYSRSVKVHRRLAGAS